jgi:hypothetical protein
MVVPRKLGIYAVTSVHLRRLQAPPVGGPEEERASIPTEPAVAAEPARASRRESPASSNFGYYTAGQTGTTISLGTDILL